MTLKEREREVQYDRTRRNALSGHFKRKRSSSHPSTSSTTSKSNKRSRSSSTSSSSSSRKRSKKSKSSANETSAKKKKKNKIPSIKLIKILTLDERLAEKQAAQGVIDVDDNNQLVFTMVGVEAPEQFQFPKENKNNIKQNARSKTKSKKTKKKKKATRKKTKKVTKVTKIRSTSFDRFEEEKQYRRDLFRR
jgi:hypothetical protein